MSVGLALAVAVGAAVGAPLRWWTETRLVSSYPRGTLLVNLGGSVVLGLLAGASAGLAQAGRGPLPAGVVVLVGSGFCGALTTFGGLAAQVEDLSTGAAGHWSWRGTVLAVVSVVAGVAVAAAAYALAQAVVG